MSTNKYQKLDLILFINVSTFFFQILFYTKLFNCNLKILLNYVDSNLYAITYISILLFSIDDEMF